METIISPFKNGHSKAVNWVKRKVEIKGSDGEVVFSRDDIEVPADWSELSTKITASKYLYKGDSETKPETSVKELVGRVVSTLTEWGISGGYFGEEEGKEFSSFLSDLCINQYGAFNSPVWFNVGLDKRGAGEKSTRGNYRYTPDKGYERADNQYTFPQCSACFIQSVDDDMESIMALATSEAMLFKFGSGTGTDLSTIRSSRETLSGGGTPSGPLSFLKIYDQVANVVKSGGKVRRAAKMNTLSVRHGDIMEFVLAKGIEEDKVNSLIKDGWDSSYNGDAYKSVAYQNENLSVRVDDVFMKSVLQGHKYNTVAVTTGKPLEELDARSVFRSICSCTWKCGDPGLQFSDTINKWHTCKGSGNINSSNPCSEYLFLDNTACNLASLNLVKFYDGEKFDIDLFEKAIRIFILAQDIIVGFSSYPTQMIAKNSYEYRTLGLGYANLGSLLMRMGLPYDSNSGRKVAAAITSLMTAIAYDCSADLASRVGCAPCLTPTGKSPIIDTTSMSYVIKMHTFESTKLDKMEEDFDIKISNIDRVIEYANIFWDKNSTANGKFRNMQVTVIAPTGTIGFLMGCDTTGIEPELALVKFKELAGRGSLKIVNNSVTSALRVMGYSEDAIASIINHIEKTGSIEGSCIKDSDLSVFDCSFKPLNGTRSIHHNAHVDMMAAVQPFISGAISKTVNMPSSSTEDDIYDTYLRAWKSGVKCIAIYRDGSKGSQPLSTKESDKKVEAVDNKLLRKKLPETRNARNHKFSIGGHEGYINTGYYDTGEIGELFIKMSKEGSTMGGLMDTIGILTSLCLQHGVPLEAITNKLKGQSFEPAGFTQNDNIRRASSIVDYVARYLESSQGSSVGDSVSHADRNLQVKISDKMCYSCGGSEVTTTGTCSTCNNCGTSLGCS